MSEKKKRRPRGTGTVYRQRANGPWWIAYRGPDGKRVQEATGLRRKGDAERLLLRRTGAREHGLPVIPRVETYTFDEAAHAKLDDSLNKGRRAVDELERRVRLHLRPHFGGRRLVAIRSDDIRAFVAKRKADRIVVRKARTMADGTMQPEQTKPVSNAEIMVRYLADFFAQIDSIHVEQYKANAKQTLARLAKLKAQIQNLLATRHMPRYLMFHDAFQYFEHEFQLSQAQFVTTSPEHISGIRHIQSLKQHIKQNNIQCIFYEPPEIPSIIQTLIDNQPIKILPLDPIGTHLDSGPDLYFTLIMEIARKLSQCMAK